MGHHDGIHESLLAIMPILSSNHSHSGGSLMDERPRKRIKLLSSDNESSDSETLFGDTGGVALNTHDIETVEPCFTVNVEYAKRFEHNQKRAELHRCK